jgi:hypothetical protein
MVTLREQLTEIILESKSFSQKEFENEEKDLVNIDLALNEIIEEKVKDIIK